MFVSGLASGIDTETLIEQLLAIERRPMVQMQQQKTLLGQQRDAWRDVNTRLNHLRERAGALRSASLFHRWTAASTAPEIVTASAKANASEGRYEIRVNQLAEAHRIRSFQFQDADAELGLAGVFTINGAEVEVEQTDSLKSIAGKINAAEDAGVAATVIDGHLILRALETGTDNTIAFGGDLTLLDGDEGGEEGPTGLGFVRLTGGDPTLEFRHELNSAKDAMFTIEGLEVSRSSNVVDDLIEGMTFTLRDIGNAEISVQRDFDGVLSAVKAFVDQYNSLQSFISSAQASNPEQGRKGLLAGDGLAMRIQSQLRTRAMGAVAADGGKYNTLMSVGVSVDRYGTMTLDESKLRDALAEDAEAVRKLFGGDADKDGFDGVAVRLESDFQAWLETNTGVLAERQKMFGERIRTLDQSMDRIEARLEIRERTLLRQFTALEEVLAAFQTQALWLEGQIQQMNAMAAAGRRR